MARIRFLCFLFLLLLLLLIIHIGVINEDFALPMAIPREIQYGERQMEEAETPCFNPPLSDNPIFSLAAVASQDPTSPPNTSCTSASTKPPALLASPCKDPAFTGQLLQRRRRIIHVILFGFEVTILLSNYSWKGIGITQVGFMICSMWTVSIGFDFLQVSTWIWFALERPMKRICSGGHPWDPP